MKIKQTSSSSEQASSALVWKKTQASQDHLDQNHNLFKNIHKERKKKDATHTWDSMKEPIPGNNNNNKYQV